MLSLTSPIVKPSSMCANNAFEMARPCARSKTGTVFSLLKSADLQSIARGPERFVSLATSSQRNKRSFVKLSPSIVPRQKHAKRRERVLPRMGFASQVRKLASPARVANPMACVSSTPRPTNAKGTVMPTAENKAPARKRGAVHRWLTTTRTRPPVAPSSIAIARRPRFAKMMGSARRGEAAA